MISPLVRLRLGSSVSRSNSGASSLLLVLMVLIVKVQGDYDSPEDSSNGAGLWRGLALNVSIGL